MTGIPGAAARSLLWPAAGGRRSVEFIDRFSSLVAIAALVHAISGVAQSPAQPGDTLASAREAAGSAHVRAGPTSEYMVAAYIGAPYTYPSDVAVRRPGSHDFTAKDVGWDGEPLEDPIYYGVRVARWFEGGRTGAMLDFTHSKTIARLAEETVFEGTLDGKPAPGRAKLGDVFRRLEASHGHNMLTLNGLLRLPGLGLRLYPYVGAGAGVALPHTEIQLAQDPARTYEYQYAGPTAQALIGLELRTARASYFLEYKFTLASYEMPLTHEDGSILFADLWRQLTRWWRGEPPPGGHVSTRLLSHQAIGGLGVRFGAVPATP